MYFAIFAITLVASFTILYIVATVLYVKLKNGERNKLGNKYSRQRIGISDIAEWRYGRNIRAYKDINEYYALEKTVRYP